MEAFTPGVIDKLGFGWDVVSKENPRLVYASVSGYGQTGPYSARAGYDPCIQAEIGLIDATGPMGGEMCRVGTAPIDYSTGLACAAGIAFALLARHKTGKGQRLDLSLFDVGMHLMSHWITNHGLTGEDPVRMGTGELDHLPAARVPDQDPADVHRRHQRRLLEHAVHRARPPGLARRHSASPPTRTASPTAPSSSR